MIVVTIFPFDSEPNGIQFGLEWKAKLSPKSYSIKFESDQKSISLGIETPFRPQCLKLFFLSNIKLCVEGGPYCEFIEQ